MVATLKNKVIAKMKKTSGRTAEKLLDPKFYPNRSTSSQDIDGGQTGRPTDRQTDMPPPKTTFFE